MYNNKVLCLEKSLNVIFCLEPDGSRKKLKNFYFNAKKSRVSKKIIYNSQRYEDLSLKLYYQAAHSGHMILLILEYRVKQCTQIVDVQVKMLLFPQK